MGGVIVVALLTVAVVAVNAWPSSGHPAAKPAKAPVALRGTLLKDFSLVHAKYSIANRIGSTPQTQTFSHDLTIRGAGQDAREPVGSATVAATTPRTCTTGTTSWAGGRPERAWLATNVSSTWQGSGGTISLSTSRTASYGVSGSVDFAVTASDLFTSVKVSYGVSLTH